MLKPTWTSVQGLSKSKFAEEWESCKFLHQSIRTRTQTLGKYWQVGDRLHIYASNDSSDSETAEIARGALILMDFFGFMSRTSHRPHVILMLLDIPKKFPRPEHDFTSSKYISSGVCFGDYLVMIWRKEEVFKVLIHELIHAHKWDMGVPAEEDYPLHSKFGLAPSSTQSPREMVTEVCTALVCAVIEGITKNIDPMEAIEYQAAWSVNQMKKCYTRFHRDRITNKIVQNTDVVSYYILKAMYLVSILVWPENLIPGFFQKVSVPKDSSSSSSYPTRLGHIVANDELWAMFEKRFRSFLSPHHYENERSLRMSPRRLLSSFPPT